MIKNPQTAELRESNDKMAKGVVSPSSTLHDVSKVIIPTSHKQDATTHDNDSQVSPELGQNNSIPNMILTKSQGEIHTAARVSSSINPELKLHSINSQKAQIKILSEPNVQPSMMQFNTSDDGKIYYSVKPQENQLLAILGELDSYKLHINDLK